MNKEPTLFYKRWINFWRWVAVLPCAIVAFIAIQLLVVALNWFWSAPVIFQDLINCWVGSICFVAAGSFMAPSRHFAVSLTLTILYSAGILAICFLSWHNPHHTLWQHIWLMICGLVSIASAILICVGMMHEERETELRENYRIINTEPTVCNAGSNRSRN